MARKDFAPGARHNGNGGWNGDGRPPAGFSFTRDDDRDFFAGSVYWGDKRFSYVHRGDDYHDGHYNHWVFGGHYGHGYHYPYHYYNYPYYRYCSPYYSGWYYPGYRPCYLPYWYSTPVFGYSYVSPYYDVPYVESYVETYPDYGGTVVYESQPAQSYVYESYTPSAPQSDSVVIYEADSVYLDGDQEQSGEPIVTAPAQPRAYTQEEPRPLPPPPGAEVPAGTDTTALPPGGAEAQPPDAGWGPILSKGNEAFAAGRFDEARQHYAAAVEADERDGYARMLLAWSTFADRDYTAAAASLRTAIAASPDLVDYPIDVRSMYGDPQAFDAQLVQLRNFVLDHPEDREAVLVLAYLNYSIGEPANAAALLGRMKESGPGDELVVKLEKAAVRGEEILKSRERQSPPPSAPAGRTQPQ